jgi:hypothetical protein
MKTKYHLNLYLPKSLVQKNNLSQNAIYLRDIFGKIPSIGEEISVSRDILKEKLPEKEYVFFNTTYKVIRVQNEVTKKRKGLESEIMVIAEKEA